MEYAYRLRIDGGDNIARSVHFFETLSAAVETVEMQSVEAQPWTFNEKKISRPDQTSGAIENTVISAITRVDPDDIPEGKPVREEATPL